jgi:hypothetical protein
MGAIAGGIVGAIVVIGCVAGGLFWYIRKRKRAADDMDMWLDKQKAAADDEDRELKAHQSVSSQNHPPTHFSVIFPILLHLCTITDRVPSRLHHPITPLHPQPCLTPRMSYLLVSCLLHTEAR